MTSPAYDRLNSGYYNSNLKSVANPGGLAGQGAVRTNFFQGLLVDLLTVVGEVVASAAAALISATNAAASAASAVNAPGTNATTTTNITPAAGAITLTLAQGNKAYAVGQWINGASAAAATTKWFLGRITAFDPPSGVMTVTVPPGYFAGTAFADGVITVGAAPSTTGVQNTRQVLTSGLASGGGDLTADRTLTVTAATAAEVMAGTSTTKVPTPAALMGSQAHQALTDGSTVAWDVRLGWNAQFTLTGTGHTMGAPTNLSDGQFVSLDINTGTGGFAFNWNVIWDFALAGVPIMPSAASKVLTVTGKYSSATGKIRVAASLPA